MMSPKVLIFFQHQLREHHGGPYSYLFHLKEGLNNHNHTIHFLSDNFGFDYEEINNIPPASFLKKFIKSLLPEKWINNVRAVNWINEVNAARINIEAKYLQQFDILHFHESIDIWRYREMLQEYKGKIIFTPHTPKPYHIELIEDVWKISANNLSQKQFSRLLEIDRYAFSKSGTFILPCTEAIESYHAFWPESTSILNQKKIYYLPTGITKQRPAKTSTEIRNEFNIPENAFVICFTGRKSSVKGYDLLIEAAKKLIAQNRDVFFLIVGKKEQTPAINHDRWIETGWTESPQDFISACDLLVIPNRHSYFDLSLLEGLSLGKSLLLSDTGGNKFFKQFQSSGIYYHKPTPGSLLSEIENCINQINILPEAGLQNEKIYKLHFRCEPFASGMIKLYATIYKND